MIYNYNKNKQISPLKGYTMRSFIGVLMYCIQHLFLFINYTLLNQSLNIQRIKQIK